ncbi:MAG: hydrolase TatD [Bacteroidetes bacterium]|nr:hydrolase TatD [Bacteroidota bacterium]
MKTFIDTHAHLIKEYYPDTLDQVVQRAIDAQVDPIILPGVNAAGIPELLASADRYKGHIYPLIGLHPEDTNANYQAELEIIAGYLDDPRVIGIGEIGLDFYFCREFEKEQIEVFDLQLGWAKERQMPLSLHIRNAYEEAIPVLKKYDHSGLKGVLHCFSGGIQEAQWGIRFGFALGVGGVVTFKNNKLQEIVKEVGLKNIVLETDAPYLAPVPYRGKTNESSYIPIIAQKVAEVTGESIEIVMEATTENALRIFDKINHIGKSL